MATLKVGLCSYMLDVTAPGAPGPTFFCITFADDTLPEVGAERSMPSVNLHRSP